MDGKSDSPTEEKVCSLYSFHLEPGSWEEASDRWLKYVADILGVSSWEGEFYKGTKKTPPGLIVRFKSEEPRLAFWYERHSKLLRVELHGNGTEDSEVVNSWLQTVRQAEQRLKNEEQQRWYAWLTSRITNFDSEEKYKLRDLTKIGEIELFPTETPSYEMLHTFPIAGSRHGKLWPIRVSGISLIGTNGEPLCAQPLERIRLIITLVTAQPWVLRGNATTSLTSYDPGTNFKSTNSSINEDEDEKVEGGEFILEPWALNAFHLMELDAQFQSAVRMYAEGLSLFEDHPSVAALCFTSVVETIAERRKGAPDICPTCKAKKGATKRFREVLGSVTDERDAKVIADMYDKRSQTVHSSRIHGSDLQTGLPLEYRSRGQINFDFQVWKLNNAARRILIEESQPVSVTCAE